MSISKSDEGDLLLKVLFIVYIVPLAIITIFVSSAVGITLFLGVILFMASVFMSAGIVHLIRWPEKRDKGKNE